MNFQALPTLISNDLTALGRALRQAHPFSYKLLMMSTIVVVTKAENDPARQPPYIHHYMICHLFQDAVSVANYLKEILSVS